MNVRINQTGAYDGAFYIDRLDIFGRLAAGISSKRGDLSVQNKEIAARIGPAGWIDNPAVCNQQGIHEKSAYFARPLAESKVSPRCAKDRGKRESADLTSRIAEISGQFRFGKLSGGEERRSVVRFGIFKDFSLEITDEDAL